MRDLGLIFQATIKSNKKGFRKPLQASKLAQLVFDNGNEFKKDFLPLLNDFAIKPTSTTIKNPQANAILERVHQVLGDMLCTKNLQSYDFDDIDP